MGSPFCGAVAYLKSEGVTRGYVDGNFHLVAAISREAVAAFLYRDTHNGNTAPTCTTRPFPDVPVANPFCGAVAYLKSTGVTRGYVDGNFHPATTISREAVAAFLYRLNTKSTP